MNTATVYDFTPSQLHRTVKKSTKATETTQAVSILDDMADAIEATHQCANLAGFSERPRAFIFALATAARSQSCDQVELCDKDLNRNLQDWHTMDFTIHGLSNKHRSEMLDQ